MPTNSTIPAGSSVDMESLYSVLVHCFVVIGSGFMIVRMKYAGESENRGMRLLLLYFLTPAMLINCLLPLRFGSVNWQFIACIFVTKAILFVTVAAITLALSKNLAKAGIYAIFATQSNDLALGYPIVDALYRQTQPEYAQYLYLAMPISLAILNPIGFAMVEIQKCLDRDTNFSRRTLALKVVKSMAANPLVVATFLGIFGNFFCQRFGLPKIVETILNGYSSAFVTVALFILGCSLAGGSKQQREYQLVTPILLVLAKSLLLPMMLRELTGVAGAGRNPEETASLRIFGFFYGCLPSAPTVFVYATYANEAVPQISQALVLSTFMAGPWIFITAQMALVRHMPAEQVQLVFKLTKSTIGYFGSFLGIFVTIYFIGTGRASRMPDVFILIYSCTCTFSSLVAGLSNSVVSKSWIVFVDFYLRLAMWTWVAALSISLYLIRTKSLCFALLHMWKLLVVGAVLPITFAAGLFLLSVSPTSSLPMWVELFISSVSVIISTYCLIQQHRNRRLKTTDHDGAIVKPEVPDIEDVPPDPEGGGTDDDGDDDDADEGTGMKLLRSAERRRANDSRMCPATFKCSERQRQLCKRALARYDRANLRVQVNHDTTDDAPEEDEIRTANEIIEAADLEKMLTLIAAACVAIVTRAFVLSWLLIAGRDADTGVFAQLEVLDTVFTYGQAICIWACFGVSSERLMRGATKRWRKWKYGSEKLQLPTSEELDERTKLACQRFRDIHLNIVKMNIAKPIRIQFKSYSEAFNGASFVDWLLLNDLAQDRVDAVKFGRRLLLGGVLRHLLQEEHFHDSPKIYYEFVEQRRRLSAPSLDNC
uniref:DEP domain-containing protein n=1 Tax=Plectus sambesii TaxID=2011161 RepID=A0A914WTP6_9BILA